MKLESQNIYESPRYGKDISEALKNTVGHEMWNDWDLIDLINEIPNKYAKKIGAQHGIFCNSGTSGLHAALMSLELKPGDEVIVPGMTFIRAVTPLAQLQLKPVLADIDPLTGNITPEAVQACITDKTKAVIIVHMWGIPAKCREISDICKANDLHLIEDCSHAHFSATTDGVVGSFGDVAFSSLQRKKTLSVGEGGLVVTQHDHIYEKLKQIIAPGSFKIPGKRVEFSGFGLNLRMSPFSSVVAKCLYPEIDNIVDAREYSASMMSKIIDESTDKIISPHIPEYVTKHSAYGFKLKTTPEITLEDLRSVNEYGRWRFYSFTYDAIADSPFWSKYPKNYPFSVMEQPVTPYPLDGYKQYLEGRISLVMPTIHTKEYWSDETCNEWKETLLKAVS